MRTPYESGQLGERSPVRKGRKLTPCAPGCSLAARSVISLCSMPNAFLACIHIIKWGKDLMAQDFGHSSTHFLDKNIVEALLRHYLRRSLVDDKVNNLNTSPLLSQECNSLCKAVASISLWHRRKVQLHQSCLLSAYLRPQKAFLRNYQIISCHCLR